MKKFYPFTRVMENEFPFKILFHRGKYKHLLHSHEYMQLCYIKKGRCKHVAESHSSFLIKGDFLSIPPYMAHEMYSMDNETTEIVIIDFMPFFINEHMRSESLIKQSADYAYIKPFLTMKDEMFPKINLTASMQSVVEELIMKITFELENKAPGYQFSVKADLLKLLITVGRELDNRQPHLHNKLRKNIYEAIDYIKENYNQPIKLEDMARISGMAPTYFSNLFKSSLDMPFIKYLNEVRIRHAMDMLKQTDYNVTEIGMRVGFNHLPHFNRTFKQITGVTPTEFRKTHVLNPKARVPSELSI